MHPLLRLFPPALLVRFLDDVHTVAQSVPSFARRFDESLDLMREMNRNSKTMLPLMEKSLPVMQEGNRNMAAVLPLMQSFAPAFTQATMLTSPIGGAIGRVVERLPGRPAQERGRRLSPLR